MEVGKIIELENNEYLRKENLRLREIIRKINRKEYLSYELQNLKSLLLSLTKSVSRLEEEIKNLEVE